MTGDLSCSLPSWWGARHRFLTLPEDLDDAHGAAATRTWLAQGERGDFGLSLRPRCLFSVSKAQQGADLCKVRLAGRVGQQAVMSDAVESIWKDVNQKAADELGRG